MSQEFQILLPDEIRTIQSQCYGQYEPPVQDWKIGLDGNKFAVITNLGELKPFTVGPMSVFYADKFAKMIEDAIIARLESKGIDIDQINF